MKAHLAPLLERRVDTLKPRDFFDALTSAWIECPRVADNVFQRASAIMEWAFAAYRSFATPRANDLAPHAVHYKSLAVFQGPIWHLVALIECDLLTDRLRLGMIGLKVHDEGKR
ncbi:hypothetical protein VSR33_01235 [Burkholderia sp. JPY164]|uniref:Uncharacterized protein n=1 Tax=Paraburkholderia guartelaensis TaxID=2546446 RepID=A0ABU9S411_9BURK